MQKEVSMTIRLEPDLRAQFTEIAELEHRPAAQVLRDLMRDYVERKRKGVAISPAERRRRQEAFEFATASVGLEGFTVSDEYRAAADRFVNGHIEFAELTEILKAGHR